MISIHHLIRPITFSSVGLLASCAYMHAGMVRDEAGHCVPGVIFQGVLCPNGKTAPSQAECLAGVTLTPADMAGLALLFNASHGVTYTAQTALSM